MARARNLAALVVLVAACGHPATLVRTTSPPEPHPSAPAAPYAPPSLPPAPPDPTTTTTAPRPLQRAHPTRVYRTASFELPKQEPQDADFDRLAGCESHGRWDLATGNGFYGGLQFDAGTWRAWTAAARPDGSSYPPRADLASRVEQIEVARRVWRARGWSPWPACSRAVGLR